MKSNPEAQTNTQIVLEERELIHIKSTVNTALGKFGEINTNNISVLLNSIELFQIRSNELVKDTTLALWNERIQLWKKKCVPHIRSNALKWPIMKIENIEQVKAFFEWLKDINILDEHNAVIEKVEDAVNGVLIKNPTL